MKSKKKSERKKRSGSSRAAHGSDAITEYLCAMVTRHGDRPLCDLPPRTAAAEFLALTRFLAKKRVAKKTQQHNIITWIFAGGPDAAVVKLRALAGQLDEEKMQAYLWKLQVAQRPNAEVRDPAT